MNKKYLIIVILSFLIFFSFPPIVTYDSSHYINYIHILENPSTLNTWDAVRGPVFPYFLFLIKKIFGFSPQIFLAIQYLLYISTFYLLLKLNKKIFKKELLILSILLFLINPIFIGYFHAILTEMIAIPLFLIITLFSLKLLEIKNINRKDFIKYLLIINLLSIFTWHLKQPYFAIILFQLLILIVIKIFRKEKILHLLIFLFASLISIVLSNNLWNSVIDTSNNNPRSSSGMIKNSTSSTLTEAKRGVFPYANKIIKNYLSLSNIYQIKYDSKAVPISTSTIILGSGNENHTIGARFLSDNENIIGGFSIIPEKEYSFYLYQLNDKKYLTKEAIKKTLTVYNYFFTLSIILTPILTIYFLYQKNYKLLLITGSSFLFLLMFATLSASIDRYAIPSFLMSIIGLIYLTTKTKPIKTI